MNSDQVFSLVERIAATPSKLEKIQQLAECEHDALMRRVLTYAMEPGRTYGMAARPQLPTGAVDANRERELFDERTWQILDTMAKRDLTGNAARDMVIKEMARLTPDSAELFWRIIANDLRAGLGDATVNKAMPGLIVEYPYMRCSLPRKSNIKQFPWQRGVYSQLKANGLFASTNFHVSGEVDLLTRAGTRFPQDPFCDMINEIKASMVPGFQYQGELLVMQGGVILPRKTGNGLLNGVARGGELPKGAAPLYVLWDRVPLEAVRPGGRHDQPYYKRFGHLQSMLSGSGSFMRLIDTKIVYSFAEAYRHYKEVVGFREEGTVVKSPDLMWADHTSKDAVKLKVEATCDLRITGIVPGKEGRKNAGRAGSLTCESECGQVRVDVTVKNEKMRAAIDHGWIGRIIAVTFNEISEPSKSNDRYSLFLPRFEIDTYRADKRAADDLQRVVEQFEAAKNMDDLGLMLEAA